jgi:nucleoside-diphosphate-sugar epimerase
MNARFLITDLIRALKSKEVFRTSSENIVRDFFTPPDFYALIQAVIDFKLTNLVLDCYTKLPVKKFDLLSEVESRFGLKYSIESSINIINATGSKMNYYSVNRAAEKVGYKPKNTSLEGIIQEINLL